MQRDSAPPELGELDTLFNVSLDLLCVADTNGYFLRLNPAWEVALGYRIDELTKRRFVDFLHPDDLPASLKALDTLNGQSNLVDFTNRYRGKDGTYRWLQWRATPSGGMIYAAGRDVTAQKEAEEALRRSDQRYKDFISRSNEGMWRVEMRQPIPTNLGEEESVERLLQDCYFAECNLAHARNLGYSCAEEVVGKSLRDLLPSAAQDPDRTESFRSAARGGWRSRTVEYRALDKAGNLKHFLRTEIPIVENGMLVRAWGIMRDLTGLKLAEESLRESEVRFRLTFENAGIGIALMDMQGRPIRSNPMLRKMLGYGEDELRRMIFTEFTHPADRERGWNLYTELAAGKLDKYELEKRYIKKDGEVMWAFVTVTLVKDQNGEPDYAIGMVEDCTERRRTQEELRRSFEQLRALAGRLQTIREEERKRVAREIHDDLGQALTAIKLDLSSLVLDRPAAGRRHDEKGASILKLVDSTIQSVRRISAELRPGILDDLGLSAAIEWAADEFEARTGTKCHVRLPGDETAIHPDHATAIFRIFQETLTNIARHASASQVDVTLTEEAHALSLKVRDNGKGFSQDQISAERSLGILGMRERAALFGGEFAIRSAPGAGTAVTVRIPEAQRA